MQKSVNRATLTVNRIHAKNPQWQAVPHRTSVTKSPPLYLAGTWQFTKISADAYSIKISGTLFLLDGKSRLVASKP